MEGKWFDQLVDPHAMRQPGRPEESSAVLFLLWEEASFITGAALPVDGGYLLQGDTRNQKVEDQTSKIGKIR